MVFYLKYRPQKIKELDSEEIRERLTTALSGKTVHHAFLFTGPKGLGKTSTARIVAKVLNCEKKKEIEPCNKCSQCLSITNGSNIDILEIDAASNRGIDEIRDLREKIRLLPAKASKKVYIIDEVHMLTTEAFNALLKTLEEPPSHAVFILCTTEPHKIPGTIVSRCFHLHFKKAKKEELLRAFQRIAKEENLNVEKDVLLHIASLSEGSFRDGVKILEELAQAGRKITKELVDEKYKISNISRQILKMIEYLGSKDAKSGLKLVGEMVEQGVDMKYFLEQMIEGLHSNILKNVGIEKESLLEDCGLDILELKSLIELFSKAHGELKYAVLPQLPLELAIIEWTHEAQNNPSASLRASTEPNTEQHRLQLSSISNSARGPVGLHPRPMSSLSLDKLGIVAGTRRGTPAPATPRSKSSSLEGGRARIDNSQRSIDDQIDLWQELILGVKPYNHSVAGVLRGCKLKSFDGKNLIIETGYKFHKERLEEKKTLEIIEKVCKEITRKPIDVSVLMKQ